MEITYENFCEYIDIRERVDGMVHYSPDERKFLWDELSHKSDDVREAILTWVSTGEMTNLSVDGLSVPAEYFAGQDKTMPMTVKLLMKYKKMNYIAAALTIDWARREPRKAILVLRRGMI